MASRKTPPFWRIFLRTFFLQTAWDNRGMQGTGFAFCLEPWLRTCCPDKKDFEETLKRHGSFFNTQPYMASWVLGTVCALEKQRTESDKDERQEQARFIETAKKTQSSALAAMGDAFFWGTLRPFCAAVALAWMLSFYLRGRGPLWIGLALYLVLYNSAALSVRWEGLKWGYQWADNLPEGLKKWNWQTWISRLRITGRFLCLLILAALVMKSAAWKPRNFYGPAVFLAAAALFRKWPITAAQLYAALCVLGAAAAVFYLF